MNNRGICKSLHKAVNSMIKSQVLSQKEGMLGNSVKTKVIGNNIKLDRIGEALNVKRKKKKAKKR